MQRRPVDTLRPIMDRALQQDPGNAHLHTVNALVTALETLLWPPPVGEADAVLALPPAVLDGMERNFFLTLLVVVAQTDNARLFKAFRERYADSIAAHDEASASWRHIDERIVELSDADELDPNFAEENLADWRRCALLIDELAGGVSASPPTDALHVSMTGAYRSSARAMLLNLQAWMDGALLELSAGGLPNEARALIDTTEALKRLPDIDLDDRRTDLPDRGDVFVDAFPIFLHRQFRAVHYDRRRRGEDIDPRPTSLHRALNARITQIRFLLDLYGHPRYTTSQPSKEQVTHQSTLRAMARPISFVDHDDFARLLTTLFLETHAPLRSDPVAATNTAWDATIRLIDDYLNTFTAHSGIDLTDDGPNYLRTLFPRTIGGELLHDCAVYAATACYWLLNMEHLLERKHGIALGLEAWFVTLPVHLGLLVKVNPKGFPGNAHGLPSGGILIVHNSHVHRLDASQLDKIVDNQWLDSPPPEDRDPKDTAAAMHKFLEDVTAALFIDGVDMPLSSKRVLKPGAAPTRDAIWDSLFDFMNREKNGKIFTKPVLVGAGRFGQFYLDYLQILMERARFFNKVMVQDLWNDKAPELYFSLFRDLSEWPDTKGPDALSRYVAQVTPLLAQFSDQLQAYIAQESTERNRITKAIEDNTAKIISPDARRSFSERLTTVTAQDLSQPLHDIREHATLCQDYLKQKSSGTSATPPPPPPYVLGALRERIL
ncbi:hypothetical protein G5B35_16580 [Parapusillimonas sp. SGNA-6]|nr:hypothetical protein [Parapusillimonas sp. SGNA-6]